jgi:hypothetical protein
VSESVIFDVYPSPLQPNGARRLAERTPLLHFRPTSLLATFFLFQPSQLQLRPQLYPSITGSLIASPGNHVTTSAAKVPPPFAEILHAFCEENSLCNRPRTTPSPTEGARRIRASAKSFNRCIQHAKSSRHAQFRLRLLHNIIPTTTADQSITGIIES